MRSFRLHSALVSAKVASTARALSPRPCRQVNIITGPTRQEVAQATGLPLEQVPESSYDAGKNMGMGVFLENTFGRDLLFCAHHVYVFFEVYCYRLDFEDNSWTYGPCRPHILDMMHRRKIVLLKLTVPQNTKWL